MPIRRSVVLFIAVAVALTVLVLKFGARKSAPTSPTEPAQPVSGNRTAAPTPPIPTSSGSGASGAKTSAAPVNAPTPPQSKFDCAKEQLSIDNDQPIVFYGKLEDQFSNSIPGAVVHFEIRVLSGTEATVKRGDVVSDGSGLFTISGYHGQDLSVVPKKIGYALASLNGGGSYSLMDPDDQRVHPDLYNPVVIKMRKLQGAEPLAAINLHFKLPFTDAPILFDLLTGQVVPAGGDIKLTVTRAPGVISGGSRGDWSVKLEAVDGGIMDSGGQEAITYEAPATGYGPAMTFLFSTKPPSRWFEQFDHGFFVVSRNGQIYSKLGLSFRINKQPDSPMYVNFSGIVNAAGSRNWEGDPNTLNPDAR